MKFETQDKIVLSEGNKVIAIDKEELDTSELVGRLKRHSLVQSTYRFFDVTVSIRSDSTELINRVNGMYSYFKADGRIAPDVTLYGVVESNISSAEGKPIFLMVPSPAKTFRLKKGAPYYYVGDEALLIERVLREMEVFILMNIRSHYFIHGGMVSLAEKGIAFPAPPLSGKTTLTLALVKRGCKFLADEYVAVDSSTFKISPFPRNLGIRKGTFALFDDLKIFYEQNSVNLTDDHEQHNVDIQALYPNLVGSACGVNYLIFPQHDASRKPKLTQISKTRAIANLVNEKTFLSLGWRNKEEALDVLVRLVGSAQCFHLIANEINETTDLVLDLVKDFK